MRTDDLEFCDIETLLRIKWPTGKSVRAVAKEMNVSPTTLIRVRRGDTPDPKTLGAILTWAGYEAIYRRVK